jgi:hypothetical protein
MPVAAVEAPIQVDHTQVSNYRNSVRAQFSLGGPSMRETIYDSGSDSKTVVATVKLRFATGRFRSNSFPRLWNILRRKALSSCQSRCRTKYARAATIGDSVSQANVSGPPPFIGTLAELPLGDRRTKGSAWVNPSAICRPAGCRPSERGAMGNRSIYSKSEHGQSHSAVVKSAT